MTALEKSGHSLLKAFRMPSARAVPSQGAAHPASQQPTTKASPPTGHARLLIGKAQQFGAVMPDPALHFHIRPPDPSKATDRDAAPTMLDP